MAFYFSRDRVLSLLGERSLPAQIRSALEHGDPPSLYLLDTINSRLTEAVASGQVKTLQELAMDGTLKPGSQFIYNGHFYGKGFGGNNKKGALRLSEKLDEPLSGKQLVLEFSKDGLVNTTAYTRMAGSTRLFAFAYVADIADGIIHAVPYVIGDLVDDKSTIGTPFTPGLELRPENVDQFSAMDMSWTPTKKDFARLATFPERTVKELICELLGEPGVPTDWGGEESDVYSANLLVGGVRQTAAFLLKGPAAFHSMTLKDCGKNADQIYRMFNIPAHVYVVQHCHYVGAAVRKTVEAFVLARSFISPCRYIIMDGIDTARLLRAHGRWKDAERGT